MKTKIIILVAISASFAMCEDGFDPLRDYHKYYYDSISPLPLQAAVCDIIGIGELESRTSTNALIRVSQYWFGNPQTNTIDAAVSEHIILPTEGANFVFFLAMPVSLTNEYGLPSGRNQYMFRMDEIRSLQETNSSPYLFRGNRSVIPVVPENTAIINWSSNLVHTAQVNPDLHAFYELIRDGHRLNPHTSRMHRDSVWTFNLHGRCFLTTNFIEQIWSDTNLTDWARVGIHQTYWKKAGRFLYDSIPKENAP